MREPAVIRLLCIVVVLTACVASPAPRSSEHVMPAAVLAASGNLAPTFEAPGSAGLASRGPATSPVPTVPAVGRPRTPSAATSLTARVVLRGAAAWCAPTKTRCRSWGGHVLLGAVQSFRWGDRPYRVRVVAGSRSVIVTIVSYCACGGNRVIDLSPFAFSQLAPLSAGLVRVRVLR